MLPTGVIVVALVVIIILVVVIFTNTNRIESIKVSNGDSYSVYKHLTDYNEAAEMLAVLNEKNVAVIRHLKDKYNNSIITKLQNNQRLTKAEDYTNNLLERYNPESLAENAPDNSDTSYTVNKGHKIYYCMRSKQKEGNPLHALSTLLFVSLHEVAHVAANQYGHGDEFWSTFKWLLKEAEIAGVYTPIDYKQAPTMYCGMEIAYNPYYDWPSR
jgi:hypothetical protein